MLRRLLTAAVGLPVLGAAIWFGDPWFFFLTLLAAGLGLHEFYRLLPLHDVRLPLAYGLVWVLAFMLAGALAGGPLDFLLASLSILAVGALGGGLWLVAAYSGPWPPWRAAAYLAAGPVYVGFLLAHALLLRDAGPADAIGRNWVLFAVLVTFATDTGAFAVGRAFGKRKMAPSISPGKTWEGAFGGFVAAALVSLLLWRLLDLPILPGPAAVTGAIASVLAQGGDLLESKLKRFAHVKDAGSIIPGHGGILDRLDSLLWAIPAVYYVGTVIYPL